MGNCENQSLLENATSPVLGLLGPVTELRVINSIWLKDYQGLFDYETRQVRRQVLTIKQNCLLSVEGDHKVQKHSNHKQQNQQILRKALFRVIRRINYFKIEPVYIENEQYTIQKLLWLVVKTVPHQKYPIREKDLIKLGKFKLKVREIVLNDPNHHPHEDASPLLKASRKVYDDLRLRDEGENLGVPGNQVMSIVTENEPICRICLQPGEKQNPLICACKCTGSVKYIHLQCLRTWLGKQLNVSKTRYCINVKWVPLTCEMCKTTYKYRIYLDNKKYYTVEIPKPPKPYIVFESTARRQNDPNIKTFHFITMSQTSRLTIGRKKDIDIKLTEDISVSRHHANLLYDLQSRRFLLEDNKSKFGTLVLVKKNLLANPFQKGISFQLAGELFTFECVRGQGSIPQYHDEERYLNVVEKGEKKSNEEEESDPEDDEELEAEEEGQNNNVAAVGSLGSIGSMANNSNVSGGSLQNIIQPANSIREQIQEVPAAQQASRVSPVLNEVPHANNEPIPQILVSQPRPAEAEGRPSSSPLQIQNLDS